MRLKYLRIESCLNLRLLALHKRHIGHIFLTWMPSLIVPVHSQKNPTMS
jgi:hypothetical protein